MTVIIGTPTGVLTTSLDVFNPMLTLTAFSHIMRYPAPLFQGIKLTGSCSPLDCDKRNAYVTAAQTAIAMMNDQLGRHNLSLMDRPETLSMKAPYFKLDNRIPFQSRTTYYMASVVYPSLPVPDDLVTISATIVPLDTTVSEVLDGVTLLFPLCNCLRLGAAICSSVEVDGPSITFQVHAYDLVDLDNMPDNGLPADSVPYLDSVNIAVHTHIQSLPRFMWITPVPCNTPPVTPDPTCVYTSTLGCLIQRRADIYEMKAGLTPTPCPVNGVLDHYELDVINVGVWHDTLADAAISLMNSRLPVDYCTCDPISNLRYRDDNGLSDRFMKVYPYSYYNPFGILTPGAQYAWNTLRTFINGTDVFRS